MTARPFWLEAIERPCVGLLLSQPMLTALRIILVTSTLIATAAELTIKSVDCKTLRKMPDGNYQVIAPTDIVDSGNNHWPLGVGSVLKPNTARMLGAE